MLAMTAKLYSMEDYPITATPSTEDGIADPEPRGSRVGKPYDEPFIDFTTYSVESQANRVANFRRLRSAKRLN
uniref:Homeobox domain-containing protein n=1 Tax=Caenorhabditis tropicalis TaxID=1561998 RepID=A0A1I7V1K9_9PELO